MATITTLQSADNGETSRGVINTNFENLNTDKAELDSPTFTGTPTLPTGTTGVTQSASDNSTALATTAYADAAGGANDISCRVYQNSGNSTGSSSWTLQTFQVEDFDTDTMFDAGTPSRITIKTAGKYMFGGSIAITTARDVGIQIKLNGTTTLVENSSEPYGLVVGTDVGGMYNFSVNDYIEYYSSSNGADTTSGDQQTNFWAYKIN